MKRFAAIVGMAALIGGAAWAQEAEDEGTAAPVEDVQEEAVASAPAPAAPAAPAAAPEAAGGVNNGIVLAPGVTLSGEIGTGVLFESVEGLKEGKTDEYETKTNVKLYNDDWGENRVALIVKAESDWGGAKARLRFTTGIGEQAFDGTYGYGWLNLLNKKLTIAAGKLDDGAWGTDSIFYWANFDADTNPEKAGVRFEIKPIEALNFGFKLPVWGGDIEDTFKSFTFGLGFTGGSLGIPLDTTWNLSLVPADSSHNDKDGIAILGSVTVAPEGLPVKFDLREYFASEGGKWTFLDNSWGGTDFAKMAGNRTALKITYSNGPLSIYGLGDFALVIDDAKPEPKKDDYATDAAYDAAHETWEKFTQAFEARLQADYKINDKVGAYFRIGTKDVTDIDGNGLYIRPGVNFSFSTGKTVASVGIYDHISGIATEADHQFKNALQINFTWGF